MSDKILVSAIMPVYGQRDFAELALRSFLDQDWPNKELIVIDDSPEESALYPLWFKGLEYIRIEQRLQIGPKRNLACEHAAGDIIVHFDSDDWSAPTRITDQVARLLSSGKAVSGYHSMLFWNGERSEAFKYKGPGDYSLGTGLCYRKEFWRAHPFVAEGPRRWEDNVFVQDARNDNEIVAADAGKLIVARIHPGNTSPKKPRENPRQWTQVDPSEIPQEFFASDRKAMPLAL